MIQKVFHFIWIDRGKSIGTLEFLSIYSKMKVYGNSHKYILWTDNVDMQFPTRNELIANGLEIRYLFDEVSKIEPKDRLWNQYQCQDGLPFECDYYKLNLLNKYGGIYSDLDSIAVRKISDNLYNNDWVSVIEKVPNTELPYGSFIGFFMCAPGNPYLYKFLYLRDRISSHYVPSIQLGILCTNTDGSYFPDLKAFCPLNFTDESLGEFLRSSLSIKDIADNSPASYEIHLFNDAIGRIKDGKKLLEQKLIDYYDEIK